MWQWKRERGNWCCRVWDSEVRGLRQRVQQRQRSGHIASMYGQWRGKQVSDGHQKRPEGALLPKLRDCQHLVCCVGLFTEGQQGALTKQIKISHTYACVPMFAENPQAFSHQHVYTRAFICVPSSLTFTRMWDQVCLLLHAKLSVGLIINAKWS